jgi:hypothetical protein
MGDMATTNNASTISSYNTKQAAMPKQEPATGPHGATKQASGKQTTPDDNTTNQQQIAKKATQTRDQLAIDQKQADKEQALLKAEQEKQANLAQQAALRANEAIAKVGEKAAPGINWVSHLPTPGGIAVLVIVLLFFLFAVTPVNTNGDTRLKLLWLTITGKTHLAYSGSSGTGKPATPTTSNNSNNNSSNAVNTAIQGGIDVFQILGL